MPTDAQKPIERLRTRLPDARQQRNGWYSARCPAHDDRHASFAFREMPDGKVSIRCFAGCRPEAILASLGLRWPDLYPPREGVGQYGSVGVGKYGSVGGGAAHAPTPTPPHSPAATYDYLDGEGQLLYQVVRKEPKGFYQRRPDPARPGEWINNLQGVSRVLYRLPEVLAAVQAGRRVYVVEGEKDADALAALGLCATTNPGGASQWLPAFSEALHGADVLLLPDNDAPGRAHAQAVAQALRGRARAIRLVALPGLPPKGDVSDWLAAGHSLADLERECERVGVWECGSEEVAAEGRRGGGASPTPPLSPTPILPASQTPPPDDSGLVKRLADAILAGDHFAVDAGDVLYVYQEGVYRAGGEKHVARRVKSLLESWQMSRAWSTHRAGEVAAYLSTDAPALWERPPLDRLNVRNGLLHLLTRELAPHSPEFLCAVQLPVAYDAQAACPEWERFVAATFPQDASGLPWEIAAWLMTPDTSLQKALLLTGEGSNGKSTFLAALTAFLGARNVSAVSLHRLEADRFSTARLMGKLANICPDLPGEHLAGTSTFKALTGGDRLGAERKFRDSFEFVPFARLVFSANHPPRGDDPSHAFFRRWLVVPFGRTFGGSEGVWECGSEGVWECGGEGVWECGSEGVWACGSEGVWEEGEMAGEEEGSEGAEEDWGMGVEEQGSEEGGAADARTPTPPHFYTPTPPYPPTLILPQRPRSELDALLARPGELSGVLNKALAALPEVRRRGLSESASMRAAWEELRETNDPLAVWLDAATVEHPEAVVARAELYRSYQAACREEGQAPLGRGAFGRALRRLRPRVGQGQRVWRGNPQVWCHLGLGLKREPEPGEPPPLDDEEFARL